MRVTGQASKPAAAPPAPAAGKGRPSAGAPAPQAQAQAQQQQNPPGDDLLQRDMNQLKSRQQNAEAAGGQNKQGPAGGEAPAAQAAPQPANQQTGGTQAPARAADAPAARAPAEAPGHQHTHAHTAAEAPAAKAPAEAPGHQHANSQAAADAPGPGGPADRATPAPEGPRPVTTPRTAEDPGGVSQTSDGTTLQNRTFDVRGTTDNDTKLDVSYTEQNGQRNTSVVSDQPFDYGQMRTTDGGVGARADAVEKDGVYSKEFQGADTVGRIRTGEGDDDVGVFSESAKLTPGGDLTTELGGGNDTYTETGKKTNPSLVIGGTGADSIETLDGDDTIYTGALVKPNTPGAKGQDPSMALAENIPTSVTRLDNGTNTANSNGGDDRVFGSVGTPDLKHDFNTGAGDDLIEAGGGTNNLDGGAGDDFMLGGNGDDNMSGGEGNDTLLGVNGNDKVDGGNGNDTVAGGRGRDDVKGGGGTDRGYDFAGEQGSKEGIENFTEVDSADNLKGFDFADGPLTENGFRAVESTPAGQRSFSNIQEGKERNDQPTTVVRDAENSSKFGDGAYIYAEGRLDSSVEAVGTPGTDLNNDGVEQLVTIPTGADGLPISGESSASNSVLVTNQDINKSDVDSPNNTNNTATVTAHEITHSDQHNNGNTFNGATITEGASPLTESNELDAIGLPVDTTGDGVADAPSADRFDNRVGESENSIRRDFGVAPRTSYAGSSPADSSAPLVESLSAAAAAGLLPEGGTTSGVTGEAAPDSAAVSESADAEA